MVNVFSALSVPQLSGLARRTALVAVGLGVVALVAAVVLGSPLFGVGACLGLAMAMVNFRLIARTTARAAAVERESHARPLVTNTLGRLGIISVIALVLAWFIRPLGFGTIVGLAVFQFTLLSSVLTTLLRDPDMQGAAVQGDGGEE